MSTPLTKNARQHQNSADMFLLKGSIKTFKATKGAGTLYLDDDTQKGMDRIYKRSTSMNYRTHSVYQQNVTMIRNTYDTSY